MPDNELERDYQTYRMLLDLWKSENPIKTNKLQVLLVVNGLLLSAMSLNGGLTPANWPIYLGGAVLSGVWVLSIGRTSLFQKLWQARLARLARKHPEDGRFQVLGYVSGDFREFKRSDAFLRIVGSVSSKYYLIGAPVLFCAGWLAVLLYFTLFTG